MVTNIEALRVHSITRGSYANGPGPRTVVHLQGCTLACPGCFSPHTWNKAGGTGYTVMQILSEIGGDDVTFSGGEPTEQLYELTALVLLLRVLRASRTILMFTGLSAEELARADAGGRSTLDLLRASGVDGIVAGRYEKDRPSNLPLRSSSNQVYIDLSGRIPETSLADCPTVEVLIDADGESTTTGFPTKEAIKALRANIGG